MTLYFGAMYGSTFQEFESPDIKHVYFIHIPFIVRKQKQFRDYHWVCCLTISLVFRISRSDLNFHIVNAIFLHK